MTVLSYETTPEFDKEFKRLEKRYRTLAQDLETLKKAAIELRHVDHIDNHACLPIQGCSTEIAIGYKVKKFSSKSLKGKGSQTGLRLTYIFCEATRSVLFVEIYYKGDKENEDRERIKGYLMHYQ